MRLIPRDESFYDLFNQEAQCIHEAAQKLVELFNNFQDVEKRLLEIEFAEHKGDQITHTLIAKLNKTFITPFDREDIHALSSALDDVLDLIDGVGSRIKHYRVQDTTPGAQRLSGLILHGTEIIAEAVAQLKKPSNIMVRCDQISQLEKEADDIKGECIAHLFENGTAPVEIMKWKEIYEALEATTDRCEDVADVLEAVVLKAA